MIPVTVRCNLKTVATLKLLAEGPYVIMFVNDAFLANNFLKIKKFIMKKSCDL